MLWKIKNHAGDDVLNYLFRILSVSIEKRKKSHRIIKY